MSELPENILELLNEHLGGYNRAVGLKFVVANADEIVAELEVSEQHVQPYGLVHGGIYAGMIESTCSTGAALDVMPSGRHAVGLENSTTFLRAVRSGTLRCVAKPLLKGRRSQVWEAQVHDARDRLVATGRVRLLVLEAGAEADGEVVRPRDVLPE